MTIIEAVILGLVEGLTEFLPVSSTGHLILAGQLLGISDSSFLSSFYIAIQLGAILAVVVWFRHRLRTSGETYKRVVVAFIPTAIVGFILYKLIKGYLFHSNLIIISALFLGGLFLIVFERRLAKWSKPGREVIDLSYREAALIGLAQAVAVVPGVSRSAATIVGGLSLNLSRQAVVEFSFLLAVPTMLAATVFDLWSSAANFDSDSWGLLAVGFVVSFITALAVIRWLLRYVTDHDFTLFGWYRMGVALIFFLLTYS